MQDTKEYIRYTSEIDYDDSDDGWCHSCEIIVPESLDEIFGEIMNRSAVSVEWMHQYNSEHYYKLIIVYGNCDFEFSSDEYHNFIVERSKNERQVINDLRSVFHEFMLEICFTY
jgi:hypothetical protein